MKQKIFTKNGSSLLVAILFMGIVLTLTLGLSNLVVREIRQTSDVVAAGRAYYAAEAGIENALFDLSRNLPGYETGSDAVSPWIDQKPDDYLHYRYRIGNKGDSIPYFADDEPVFLAPDSAVTKDFLYSDKPDKTYNVLKLHESVDIPLSADDGNGNFEDVKDLLIQYYVDFDLDENIDIQEFKLQKAILENFDILRWRVYGSPENDLKRTESISDYFPAHSNDGPTQPVCIGTDQNLLNEYNCITPVARDVIENADGRPVNVDEAPLDAAWSIARQCYLNDAGGIVAPSAVHNGCSIKTFIDTHKRNYITLTNAVPPDIIGISNLELRAARANIYYRVIARKGPDAPKLVRDFAHISADGFAGGDKVKQSIDAKIHRRSFLPVFNFSLYRTDTQSDVDSPAGGQQNNGELF